MEFKLLDKKNKKEVISIVVGSHESYIDDYGKLLSSKKGKKIIKKLLKNKKIYTDNNNEVTFINKEDEYMDSIFDIYYFSEKYESITAYIVEFINSNFIKEGKNFILYINELDKKTIESLKDNKKIMFYNNDFFASSINNETSEEEWIPCEELKNFFINNSALNYDNNQEQNISNNNENIDFVENENIEANIQESKEDSNLVQEDTNLQDNDLYEETLDLLNEENKKDDRNWYNDFYNLQGNSNNNIKSTADRFNFEKIKRYEMIKDHCEKFDINDLNTLRSNSSIKFGTKNSYLNTSYDKSKNDVENQLRKLKSLNNKNQSMISSEFYSDNKYINSNKTSSDQIMSRINDLKKKLDNKK